MSDVKFVYQFEFSSGEVTTVEAVLDPNTLALKNETSDSPPLWASIENVGCEHCALREKHRWCPLALRLRELIDAFDHHDSYEKVELRVETPERTIIAKTSLQAGLGSLMGIYMVTAGCPTLDKLRPMVRFHLPLATELETVYRATSMYLFAQYFIAQSGGQPDWELKNMDAIYAEVREVNQRIAATFRKAADKDANANALIRLDLFAQEVSYSIAETMAQLRQFFAGPYL